MKKVCEFNCGEMFVHKNNIYVMMEPNFSNNSIRARIIGNFISCSSSYGPSELLNNDLEVEQIYFSNTK